MLTNFQYRHLPALFTAAAQCWGTIWPLVSGSTRSVMLHYGLPERVADVPETWTVWHVGNARTACLGILMFTFYAQRRYDVLDTFLIATGYLGLIDCYILWNERLPSTGIFRLLSSSVFAALGLIGFTQGPKS
ncbi:hypothetical protein LA080_009162 [Diaporthe eres]|uniref:Uncharacterized protein n=1 Tax=Diaporthe vaccinii TaxID=105482 RepID=A0ABR4DWA0_9PEZI|nr:hypothetical protein LA080_009162 [Diaporthe eres]